MSQLENIAFSIGVATFALLIGLAFYSRLTNGASPRLRAVSALIICYGLALSFAGFGILAPYSNGFVLRTSRRSSDNLIPLSDPSAIYTLAFNIGLVALLLAVGTYLCIYTWRKATPKP